MKISREHNPYGSKVYIKNQTSIQVWPLRSELSMFTRSFEPLTQSPTECYNACFSSLCWTRDLWPDYPRVRIALWKHLTLDNLYHTCQCYSKRLTLMQNDKQLCRFQNLSTSSFNALILSTFGIPFALYYSLRPQPTSQMQSTTTQTPQPGYLLSSKCTPIL